MAGGFFHIFVQFDNYAGPREARIGERIEAFESLGLGLMAHEDGVNCTAQHVREGSLIVYDPRRKSLSAERPQVSVLDFLPSALKAMGAVTPAHARGEPSIAL